MILSAFTAVVISFAVSTPVGLAVGIWLAAKRRRM